MAYTEADLQAVKAAIARGEKSVQFADRLVTYRSIDELVQAKQIIEAELGSSSRTTLAYGKDGY